MGRLWEWGKWSVVVHVFEMFKKFEMTVRWPCGGVLVAATGAETGLGAERVAGEGGLGQSPPPCLALPAWLRPLSAPQVSFQHEVYPAEPATGPTGPAAPGQELEERPLSRQVFIVQELEVRDRLASSQIDPTFPALIPADVATKAQGWARPLQGQIQGSHWAAGSGRYSLRSEGQSQCSLRKSP